MSNSRKIILITGACSSGKSEFAEILAQQNHKSVIYVATAKVDDHDREWATRILKHQQRRPATWKTITINIDIPSYLKQASTSDCLLIDSLGTWVANLMELDKVAWQEMSDRFLSSLQTTAATTILVGEETGWGVVPAYPMGRLFRDRLGKLSRQVGNVADVTYLVAGGHVINLSVLGEPLKKYGI
ncbi:MAG: bifunctional cobalamin biosynthesis protein CobP [Cyanobacteriota bacterium]|jgi:adenosylcobinamide kinase/adenosylcobinamide-phosphate guanylyltransferase